MKRMDDAMGDLRRLKAAIEESPFDGVVALSPENLRYVADAHIATQIIIRDRLSLVLWAKGREPVFIFCRVDEGYVRETSWIEDLRPYKEFVTSPIDLLADALTEMGLDKGRIGVELKYLPVVYHQQLMDRLPHLVVEPCEPLFDRVRMHKTPRERAILADAFRATEKALMSTYVATKVGDTEKDMALRLSDGIDRYGADDVAFRHVNAGPNTGFPHIDATDYRVRPGDILKADCGGYFKRYMSNVGRTAKVGKPTDEDNSWWRRLRDIHLEIVDMLRPGNTGRQLFERATQLHEKHGVPFPFAHNGHGIGLFVHEHPILGPHEEIPYEPGMVSTVETRVRWVNKVGYHMEDLYEITAGAPVLLSDYFDNEEILVV